VSMSADDVEMVECVRGCGVKEGQTWRSRRRVGVVGSMTGGIPSTLKEQ
jgi:hypothetical protein